MDIETGAGNGCEAKRFMQDFHEVADNLPHPGLAWALQGCPDATPEVGFSGPLAPDRRELEAFIGAAFRRQHGASVRSYLPLLVSLRDADGALAGAAGYRNGSEGPLYLEQYLAGPVEMVIARQTGAGAVARETIAEIGNFACRDCATATKMMGVLADLLREQRHDWVVFTATRTVRGIMRRMGLRLAELARAERSCLVAADDWGRYYEQDPRVMLGYVPSWDPAAGRNTPGSCAGHG